MQKNAPILSASLLVGFSQSKMTVKQQLDPESDPASSQKPLLLLPPVTMPGPGMTPSLISNAIIKYTLFALGLHFKWKHTVILHALFYIQLFVPLEIIIPKCIHIVTCGCSSFILIAVFYSIVWIYLHMWLSDNLFSDSNGGGYLGYARFGSIRKRTCLLVHLCTHFCCYTGWCMYGVTLMTTEGGHLFICMCLGCLDTLCL